MNKIFKVIFNQSTQTWTVVSELAKSATKVKSQSLAITLFVLSTLYSEMAWGAELQHNVEGRGRGSFVAWGLDSKANASETVAIGHLAQANYYGGVSVGYNTDVAAKHAVAIGFGAKVTGASDAYASATALGYSAKASAGDGVALGSHSVTTRFSLNNRGISHDKINVNPNNRVGSVWAPRGVNSNDIKATIENTKGAVSVGDATNGTGKGSNKFTRQIINVAAGSADSDAANVAQLRAVASILRKYQGDDNQVVSLNLGGTLKIIGGNTQNITGIGTTNYKNIKTRKNGSNNIEVYLDKNIKVESIQSKTADIKQQLSVGNNSSVTITEAGIIAPKITFGSGQIPNNAPFFQADSGNIKLGKDNGGTAVKLTNLAEGSEDSDAATYKQVKDKLDNFSVGVESNGSSKINITKSNNHFNIVGEGAIKTSVDNNNIKISLDSSKLKGADSTLVNGTIKGDLTVLGQTHSDFISTPELQATEADILEAYIENAEVDTLTVHDKASFSGQSIFNDKATFSGGAKVDNGLTVDTIESEDIYAQTVESDSIWADLVNTIDLYTENAEIANLTATEIIKAKGGVDLGEQGSGDLEKGDTKAVSAKTVKEVIDNMVGSLPIVFTDDNGNIYTKKNGKWYKNTHQGKMEEASIDPRELVATLKGADGVVTEPLLLTNIANGTRESDAVNAGQLRKVVEALGGDATIMSLGEIKAPTYMLTEGDPSTGNHRLYHTVGEALNALNQAVMMPITFMGNQGTFNSALGNTMLIQGSATTAGSYSSQNIKTVMKGNRIEIQLADTPRFKQVNTSIFKSDIVDTDVLNAKHLVAKNLAAEKVKVTELTVKNTIDAKGGVNLGAGSGDIERGDNKAVSAKAVKKALETAKMALTSSSLKYEGDVGGEISLRLGEKLSIKGGNKTKQDLTDNNIGVVKDNNANTLNIKLASNLVMGVGSIKFTPTNAQGQDVILNSKGLQVIPAEAKDQTKQGQFDLTKAFIIDRDNGIQAGGKPILYVGDGTADHHAATYKQVKDKLDKFSVGTESNNAGQTVEIIKDNSRFNIVGEGAVKTTIDNRDIKVSLDDDKLKEQFKRLTDLSLGNANIVDKLTAKDLEVTHNATVKKDLTVEGKTELKGEVTAKKGLTVEGDTTFKGKVIFDDEVVINKVVQDTTTANANITEKLTTKDFEASGEATFKDTTVFEKEAFFDDGIMVNGELDAVDIIAQGSVSTNELTAATADLTQLTVNEKIEAKKGIDLGTGSGEIKDNEKKAVSGEVVAKTIDNLKNTGFKIKVSDKEHTVKLGETVEFKAGNELTVEQKDGVITYGLTKQIKEAIEAAQKLTNSGVVGGNNKDQTGKEVEGATANGKGSQATGKDSTATGTNAQATADGATASGAGSQATGEQSTATGQNAQATGNNATASGAGAKATGKDSTATGTNAQATGTQSTASGQGAVANNANTTATGQNAQATGNNATASGANSKATADGATASGAGSQATGEQSTATGQNAQATGNNATASGANSKATADGATASGAGSQATGTQSTANGAGAKATKPNSTATGADAKALGDNSTANGQGAQALGNDSTATGQNAQATADGATASGANSKATADGATASGAGSQAMGEQSTATGMNAKATAKGATANGADSQATGENSTVVGHHSTVAGENATAFGSENTVNGKDSGAFGHNNSVETDNSYALGNNIKQTLANSVFLGSDSGYVSAGESSAGNESYSEAKVGSRVYQFAGGKASEVAGVVSVGNKGANRRIQNVAPGLIAPHSTDAVNGSQLYAVVQGLSNELGMKVQEINSRIQNVDNRLQNGIASAVAAASLVQAYNPSDSLFAIGVGSYRGRNALAIGYSKVSDSGKVIFKVTGSVNQFSDYTGGASIGFKF